MKSRNHNCPICGCPGGPHGVTNSESPSPSRAFLIIQTDDFFMGLSALSEYGGLSVKQLRGYINRSSNPLPAFQTDGGDTGRGKLLVKRSEYDQWVERNLRKPSRYAEIDAAVAEALDGF